MIIFRLIKVLKSLEENSKYDLNNLKPIFDDIIKGIERANNNIGGCE